MGESAQVSAVREQLVQLPWKCEARHVFRDHNLGCFRNISEGISWFLKEADEGIILEDDCFADESFFPFCNELLNTYRRNERVFAISGHTGRAKPFGLSASYDFSHYFGCWGWATWRRAWECFDPDLTAWRDEVLWRDIVRHVLPNRRACLYWRWMFGRVAAGKRDSWAYRFLLSIWREGGLVVVPDVNLIHNVGAGEEATHAGQIDRAGIGTRQLAFPLSHPDQVRANRTLDQWFEDEVHSKSWPVRCAWGLQKLKRNLVQWEGRAAC